MVNLMLEARVRYPLYIIIYCKQVYYTADSLVSGHSGSPQLAKHKLITVFMYSCVHNLATIHRSGYYTVLYPSNCIM